MDPNVKFITTGEFSANSKNVDNLVKHLSTSKAHITFAQYSQVADSFHSNADKMKALQSLAPFVGDQWKPEYVANVLSYISLAADKKKTLEVIARYIKPITKTQADNLVYVLPNAADKQAVLAILAPNIKG